MKKWSKRLIAAGLCAALTVGSGLTVFAQEQGTAAAVQEVAETGETAGPVQAGEEIDEVSKRPDEGSYQQPGELKDIEEEKIPLADAVAQGSGFLGALGIGGGVMAILIFSSIAIVSVRNRRNESDGEADNRIEE